MPTADAYQVRREPFYQPQGHEAELYAAAYAARLPVMLKGPTGCGKSRFVEYMAWKLGRPLITVACNEDMTASDLVGRYLLEANGTRWLDGPLTQAARIYSPENIIGTKVVMLANLAPRKIKGITSHVMILMAENAAGELSFVSPEKVFGNGSVVK